MAETVRTAVPVRTSFLAPRRPMGFIRGSLVGFLLGVTAAGTYGYFKLFDEYQSASTLLLVSVEELKASTHKLSEHLRRIETAEREIGSLKSSSVTTDELDRLKREVRQVSDGQSIDLMDLKSHLWGVEQDLKSLADKASNRVNV